MFGLIPFRMTRGNNTTKSSLTDLFDNFFNDDFTAAFNGSNDIKADVRETNEAYLVEAELPGVNKEDLRLDYDNNYLTISAMKNETFEDRQDNYLRQERHYGQIARSFYFDNVDKTQIQARFQNGVLDIILPKRTIGRPSYNGIPIQ